MSIGGVSVSGISDKQRVFADAFLESQIKSVKERAAEAANLAGYKPGGAMRLLSVTAVKDYLGQRQLEMARSESGKRGKEIAGPEDVAAFLTSVMNGDSDSFGPADLRDQMKAAEYLGKYHGMFNREHGTQEAQPVIISGDDELET